MKNKITIPYFIFFAKILKGKFLLLIILFMLSFVSYGQKKIRQNISEDSIINKWIKAVINVEGRYSYNKRRHDYDSLADIGKLNYQQQDSLSEALYNEPYLNNGETGSAIYLLYNGHHYLLTAKHVIIDTTEYEKNYAYRKFIVRENLTSIQNHYTPLKIDTNGNVFLTDNNAINIEILNGWKPENRSFLYTDDSTDLATIALDGCLLGSQTIKKLEERGNIPVTFNDIDSICRIINGNTIYAFGYPRESEVYYKNLPRALANWESYTESVPFVSKGTSVSGDSTHFEGQIFTYHGNSGGAIVRNNKLVGITHGFRIDTFKIIGSGEKLSGYMFYHSVFTKASLLIPLLKEAESLKLFLPFGDKMRVR